MVYKLKIVSVNKQTEKLLEKGMQVFQTVLVKKDGQIGMSKKSMLNINLLDEAGAFKPGDVVEVDGTIEQARMINKEGVEVDVQWFEPA